MKVIALSLLVFFCGDLLAVEPAIEKGDSQNANPGKTFAGSSEQGDWSFVMDKINKEMGNVDSAVLELKSNQEIIELTFTRKENGLFSINVNRKNLAALNSEKNSDESKPQQPSTAGLDLIHFFIPPPSF